MALTICAGTMPESAKPGGRSSVSDPPAGLSCHGDTMPLMSLATFFSSAGSSVKSCSSVNLELSI